MNVALPVAFKARGDNSNVSERTSRSHGIDFESIFSSGVVKVKGRIQSELIIVMR
jgi:hypothetical protein